MNEGNKQYGTLCLKVTDYPSPEQQKPKYTRLEVYLAWDARRVILGLPPGQL
jgi:hypothetical protein